MKKEKYIYEVIKNQLYAGEYPREKDEEKSKCQIHKMLAFGYTAFIDLTEENETNGKGDLLLPYKELLPDSVKYKRLPLPAAQFPKSLWHLLEILDYIDLQLKYGEKVYLHSRIGYDRTSIVAAAWFVYIGMSPEVALKVFLDCSRKAIERYKILPLVLDEDEEKDYIFRFHKWLKSNRPKWETDAVCISDDRITFCNFQLSDHKNIMHKSHNSKATLTNLKTGQSYRLQFIETQLLLKFLHCFGEYLTYDELADDIWTTDGGEIPNLRGKLKVAIAKLKKKIATNSNFEITNNHTIKSYKFSLVNRS
jgi:hypothetical protein